MITQLMTNIYIVRKSLVLYLLTAVVSSLILFIFGGENMQSLAVILTFMLIITPSLEVMNHQSKSGYDTFVLTLPVKRRAIVQAHYFFYALTVFLASIAASGTALIADVLIEGTLFTSSIYSLFGLGIALSFVTGAVWYPLLYLFGTEKSEGILIVALLISIGATIGMERGLGRIMGTPTFLTMTVDFAIILAFVYLFSSLILYSLSFFIAQLIYSRKEF